MAPNIQFLWITCNVVYVLLFASPFRFISGITLLGTPADIYSYGTQYYAIVIGIFFMAFAISYLFIPVFVNLGVRSSFEVKVALFLVLFQCQESD